VIHPDSVLFLVFLLSLAYLIWSVRNVGSGFFDFPGRGPEWGLETVDDADPL